MRLGRAADHSPPSSAAVMEEYSCTSTHPLGHTGPVTGSLYLYPLFPAYMRFLGRFEKVRRATIDFGMSVCLPPYGTSRHPLTDFHET